MEPLSHFSRFDANRISISQKCICTRCYQPYPDTKEFFPLKHKDLSLLTDELGIEVYQCKSCIRKGVERTNPPRPIYGNNVAKYIRDVKAGIAIAYLVALFISIPVFFIVLLVSGEVWQVSAGIASLVFAVILTAEAVLYLAQ